MKSLHTHGCKERSLPKMKLLKISTIEKRLLMKMLTMRERRRGKIELIIRKPQNIEL